MTYYGLDFPIPIREEAVKQCWYRPYSVRFVLGFYIYISMLRLFPSNALLLTDVLLVQMPRSFWVSATSSLGTKTHQ